MGLVVGGLGGLATDFYHNYADNCDLLASQGLPPVLEIEDSDRKSWDDHVTSTVQMRKRLSLRPSANSLD